MTTLLIGAGLVGSHTAARLLENGDPPVILDAMPQMPFIRQIVGMKMENLQITTGDVLDLPAIDDLARRHEVDSIIHTAANPRLTVGAQKNPYDAIRVNIMGLANVLELARRRDMKRVVFTSSSVLYSYKKGGLESGQLSEDNYPRPTSIYASTKLAGENLGLNYADHYGLDFVAVRLGAVFGPWSGAGGGGPSSMFKQLMERALRGEHATISARSIDLVYSKDVAKGIVLALDAKNPRSRVYNIGMGKVYTPEEIASIIKEKVPSAMISVEDLAIGTPAIKNAPTMELKRSREELGYSPSYDMPLAVENYVSFLKSLGPE